MTPVHKLEFSGYSRKVILCSFIPTLQLYQSQNKFRAAEAESDSEDDTLPQSTPIDSRADLL